MAESVDDASTMPDPPQITVPRVTEPPQIDGNPDDPAWDRAARIDSLELSAGPQAEGLEPVPTEVRLLWSSKFLYVRFRCTDTDLHVPHHGRDADLYKGDVVEVFLDGVGDGRQYIELQVSPAGDVLDLMHVLSGPVESRPDGMNRPEQDQRERWLFRGWDCEELRTAARVQKNDDSVEGWVVEMAVPAPPVVKRRGKEKFAAGMDLRANFVRYERPMDPDTDERIFIAMNWSPVMWGNPHRSPARMGKLSLTEE
ncbi:MAG: carbohydrate-binding family 9-like protein [Candidatus Brocadiia bacterium]